MQRKHHLWCAIMALAIAGIAHQSFGDVFRVDGSVDSSGNGSTWPLAFKTIEEALDEAVSGDEIWVARATNPYKPDATDPEESFNLKDGVHILGGFNGTETLYTQRNIYGNETILSGDLDDDGHTPGDDSYHVVVSNGNNPATALIGFTITGGGADGGGTGATNETPAGAGLIGWDSDAAIVGCTFVQNVAGDSGSSTQGFGGAIASFAQAPGEGLPQEEVQTLYILNCTFDANAAAHGGNGGGLYVGGMGYVTVVNSLFTDNDANGTASEGGAMYLDDNASPSDFVNCTIADNAADGNIGGLYSVDDDIAIVRNCILWGNSGSEISGSQDVEYSCVQGDVYPGTGNTNENPVFDGSTYRLSATTPFTVRDAGDDDVIDDFLDEFDLDGDGVVAEIVLDLDLDVKRIIACHVDMGAYEFHVGLSGQCTDADLNTDCTVNVLDLLLMLGAWGPNEGHPADLNDDDTVNVLDLLFMLSDWGPCTCASECGETLETSLGKSDLTMGDWNEFMGLFEVEPPDDEEIALYAWWLHHYFDCHYEQTCPGVMGAPDDDPYGGH